MMSHNKYQNIVSKLTELLNLAKHVIRLRFDNSRIVSVENLVNFIHTRAAYVAQTALYGYLKTRMGRQYVEIFRDDKFAPSLNMAKWEVYAACISDLSIFAIATIARETNLTAQQAIELATYCQRQCIGQTFKEDYARKIHDITLKNCIERNQRTIWPNASIGDSAFTRSPDALASSSPVTDEYRELDREIVKNSIRFRWSNIREEFLRRIDYMQVIENWKQHPAKQANSQKA